MKLAVAIAFFFSLCHINLSAQDKVKLSGKVTDSSGQPVAYATVGVENTRQGTYTNDNGLYTLELPAESYKIVVSSIGYKTIQSEINIKEDKKQNFVLEENTVKLESIEVYGKTKTQQTRESSFAVNALQVSSLQNTSATLSNIIARTTSVRIREEGGVGSDFKLSINGLSGHSIRYFIDGIPLASLGSGITLANIPTNIVDRIEIYKGVVPTYLGADALGGAINIITKQNNRNYLDVSYGAGSFHTHKADFSGQYVHKPSGFIVRPVASLSYSKNNYTMKNVEVWDEEAYKYKEVNVKRFHDDYFSFLGQLEAGFLNRTWTDAMLFSGSVSVEDKDIQTGEVQTTVYGKARRESDAWSISAQYRKREFLIKKLGVDFSLSYTHDTSVIIDTVFRQYTWDGNYTETHRREMYNGDKSMRHYKRPRIIGRANVDYALAPNHVINFNYLYNSIKNNRWDEIDEAFNPSEDKLAKHILGIVYNQSLLKGRWINNVFLKHYINQLTVKQTDDASKTGSKEMAGSSTTHHTGYGIGSRFTLWQGLSLKASYEHSIRLPVAMEYLGNGYTTTANFLLKPENSDNFNLGLFGTWHPAKKHRLFYEAGGFLRLAKDFIRRAPGTDEAYGQYKNLSNVTVKGVEGEIRYEYNQLLQAIVNCSYQDARNMTEYGTNGMPNATYKNKIPNQPWLFSNAELNLTLKDLLGKESLVRVGYHYQYTHWFFYSWEGYGTLDSKEKIPTQHVHSANVTCSFRKERYNVSLECNNMFDRMMYDNFRLQKPGRSFFVKFRLFIN